MRSWLLLFLSLSTFTTQSTGSSLPTSFNLAESQAGSNSGNRSDHNDSELSRRLLLAKLTTLSFHRNQSTLPRREQPKPQIQCTSFPSSDPNLCQTALKDVQTVRCRKDAHVIDPDNIIWLCLLSPSIPYDTGIRLGKPEVSCEGWDSHADSWIVEGSCSVTVRVFKLGEGNREWIGQRIGWFFVWLFALIVVAAIAIIAAKEDGIIGSSKKEIDLAESAPRDDDETTALLDAQQNGNGIHRNGVNGHTGYGTTSEV
jgi:hypothetical protein